MYSFFMSLINSLSFMYKTYNSVYLAVEYPSNIFSLYAYGLLCVSVNVKKGIEENLLYGMPMHNEKIIFANCNNKLDTPW